MKDLIEQAHEAFFGKSFCFKNDKRIYKCFDVIIANNRLTIKTNRRFFVFSKDTEYYNFEQSAQFDVSDIPASVEENSHNAVVQYTHPEHLDTITNSLVLLFEKAASGKASADDYKAMKASSELAGKIIDAEKVKIAYAVKNSI